jgi:hypothetical protein
VYALLRPFTLLRNAKAKNVLSNIFGNVSKVMALLVSDVHTYVCFSFIFHSTYYMFSSHRLFPFKVFLCGQFLAFGDFFPKSKYSFKSSYLRKFVRNSQKSPWFYTLFKSE